MSVTRLPSSELKRSWESWSQMAHCVRSLFRRSAGIVGVGVMVLVEVGQGVKVGVGVRVIVGVIVMVTVKCRVGVVVGVVVGVWVDV